MSQYVPKPSTMWREKGRMWDEIGEFTLCSPLVPSGKSTFLNPGRMRAADQYFEHTELPSGDEYENWPTHKQQQLEDQEWSRREQGVWFYNYGTPTYITGKHYYFLNYHRYGGEKPTFREADRRFFWLWEHCLRSPNCFGLFIHTRRRYGKTGKAASIGLEAVTRIPFLNAGIQSKTEKDAKELYEREILGPVEELAACPWFNPETPGGARPKMAMMFDVPASNKRGAKQTGKKGLKSKISYLGSVNNAYDGQNLGYFLNDEVGKDQLHDPYARWLVVKKMFTPNGRTIVGKSMHMTTSDEEPDANKALEICKQFWYNSDQTKLGPNGLNPEAPHQATPSGLFRLFVPAWEGVEADMYGRDTEEGRDTFLGNRATVAHDPIALLREKRANPFSIDEAHLPALKSDCIFNATHISHVQSEVAEAFPPAVKRYKLYWVDFTKTKVAATEDANGRFYLPWLPPAEWQNKVQAMGQILTSRGMVEKYKPLQAEKFCAGGDPIDMQDPEARASQGAGHGFYRYDHEMEKLRGKPGYWPSHSFVMEYAERPDDPDDYYEDLLMYCHWMGCTIFPETNKSQILRYFKARGYEKFLAHRPADTMTENTKNQKKAGAASSPLIIGQYVAAQITYVQRYVGSPQSQDSPETSQGYNDEALPYDWRRLPFTRTLSQLLSFVPSEQANRRSHDLAVSVGFTLLNANRYLPQTKAPAAGKGLSLGGVRGMLSIYR